MRKYELKITEDVIHMIQEMRENDSASLFGFYKSEIIATQDMDIDNRLTEKIHTFHQSIELL